MKLTGIKTFVVGNPPPQFGGRYFVFVKLETDNGSTGLGEAYCVPFEPHLVAKMIEDVFARYAAGNDPHDIETLWRRVYSSGFTQHPDLTLMGVLSALEMACWDIIGKEANKPVYKLLGGQVHERLRAYTYIYPRSGDQSDVYYDPDLAAERAGEYLAQGFTALKFDPAGPYSAFDGRQLSLEALDLSERFAKQLREVVGNKADLLFGTHGQFTTPGAIRMGKAIEPFNPLWYEEPCPPDNLLEFAEIAKHVNVPLATGERLTTKAEFGTLLRAGGVRILQPALGRVGGIMEAKKIAAIAEIYNAEMAPHLYAGPVEWAANVHFAASIPNLLIAETIEDGGTFHQKLIKNTIKWEDGYILPPDAPGLGIEFDEEVARAHPYIGSGLHLQMQEAPCDYRNGNRFEGGAPSVE